MEKMQEEEYDLYIWGECVSQHKTLKAAKKAFDEACVEFPDAVIDVLSADGEISYYGIN